VGKLAWILVGGGAFTVLAGYLASRASAHSGSSALTAADNAFVQAAIAHGAPESDIHNLIVFYTNYKTNYAGWLRSTQHLYPNGIGGRVISSIPRDLSLAQLAEIFH
jgi:hypothetical protein